MTKITHIILAALTLLAFAGCATTTPVVTMDKAQFAASIIQPLAQGGVPLVLNKNPQYANAVLLLSEALPAALGAGDLSPTGIAGSIALANDKAKLGISPDAQALIANLISIGVGQYQTHYGTAVATATDPGIALMISAFAKGLHDGVTGWQASHPGA